MSIIGVRNLDFSAGSSSWGMGMTIKHLLSSNITGKVGDVLIHYQDAGGETSRGILFINNEKVQALKMSTSSKTVFADINGDGRDDFIDFYTAVNSTWDSNIAFALSNGNEIEFDKQPSRFLNSGIMVIKQGANEEGGYMSRVVMATDFPGIIGVDLNGDSKEEILVIGDMGKTLHILSWQENEFLELARYSLPFMPVNMSYLESKGGHIIDILGVLESGYYILRIEGSQDNFVTKSDFSRLDVEETFPTVNDMISTSKGVYFVASKERDTGFTDILYVLPE